jgi:alkylated DNA repair dioxygenase AlkB
MMIKELLEFVTGEEYNLCLLNLYEDRKRNIGKHSDDEKDLADGSRIASVSLGAPRRFCLEPKNPGGNGAADLAEAEFAVVHGCLLTMGGRTQELFKHWVPPGKEEEGPRVNLTFRRVVMR